MLKPLICQNTVTYQETLLWVDQHQQKHAVKALADEFTALFPKVTYRYDATGSGAGVKNAISGTYTLGFASA